MAGKATSGLRLRLRVGRHYVADRLSRRRITALKDVPPFSWAVTPEWATAAICGDRDARVVSVEHENVSAGTTDRNRLFLRYEGDPEVVAGLPASVFVKSTDSFRTRLHIGAVGGASGEIRFYRHLEPTTPIFAPKGYHGAVDRASGRSILLIEDLAVIDGLQFGDCRAPLDRAKAEAMVDELAVVHGCLLDSDRFRPGGDLAWMTTSLQMQEALNGFHHFDRRTVVGVDRSADVMPASVRAQRDRIHPGLMRSLELDRGALLGLNHSDVHAGNWFHMPDGRLGLYDWSAIVRGQGTRDLAYALMSGLTVEDRRDWERDLVARYTQRRSEVSGIPADDEQVWTSYRQQTLHGLVFWLVTIGRSAIQPEMQLDEVSLTNIERMSQAVEDLDTFALLAR
jgi:hypothetical protein